MGKTIQISPLPHDTIGNPLGAIFSEWLVQVHEKRVTRPKIVVMDSDPAPSPRPGARILDMEGGDMLEAIVVLVAVGILAVEVIEVRHKCN